LPRTQPMPKALNPDVRFVRTLVTPLKDPPAVSKCQAALSFRFDPSVNRPLPGRSRSCRRCYPRSHRDLVKVRSRIPKSECWNASFGAATLSVTRNIFADRNLPLPLWRHPEGSGGSAASGRLAIDYTWERGTLDVGTRYRLWLRDCLHIAMGAANLRPRSLGKAWASGLEQRLSYQVASAPSVNE
jgi:hypothetical protein